MEDISLNPRPIESAPKAAKSGWHEAWRKLQLVGANVPLVEKMAFTRHLSLMIKAGFSLPQGLGVLVEQAKSAYFKGIISSLSESVRKGKLFSEALADHPKVFPEIFMNMVRVGEASGNLDEVLTLLAEQLRKEHELRSRVQGAMMYPGVIFVAMVAVGIFMMVFIMPSLAGTLKDLGVPLPITTQIIIVTSTWVAKNIFLFLGLLGVMVFGSARFLKSRSGQRITAFILTRAPIMKKLTRQINSARIARTLGSLLTSGVPLVEALEITARTVRNPYYQDALQSVAEKVPKGEKLEPNLRRFPKLFPPMVAQMVGVGEEAGALTDILKNLAEFFEEEVDVATKNLSSLLEPLLLIFIGVGVGFFVVSMLLPMFSVYGNL